MRNIFRRIWNTIRPPKPGADGCFWQFVRNESAAEGEPEADLLLYGIIGDDGWWSDVSSRQFAEELAGLGDVSHIRVRINSPGGDVFAAQAIYSLLRQHKAKITVNIDGWAASAATIVAMVGDEIIMPGNTMMMVHNPWTIAWGDAREMRSTADVLDQVRETIIAAYQDKSGMGRDELIALMDSETWMTAEEAAEKGFVDTVIEPVRVAACAAVGRYRIGDVEADLTNMRVWPGAMLATAETPEAEGDPAPVEEAPAEPVVDAEPVVEDDASASNEPEPASEEPATAPEASSVDDAVAAERARLRAIDELAVGLQGVDELVFRAKYGESPMTPEQFSLEVVQSGAARNSALLQARRQGAEAAGVPAGSADLTSNDGERKANAQRIAEHIKSMRGGK